MAALALSNYNYSNSALRGSERTAAAAAAAKHVAIGPFDETARFSSRG